MSLEFPQLLNEFSRAVQDLKRLYRDAVNTVFRATGHEKPAEQSADQFAATMDNLQRGLVTKMFADIAGEDRGWSREEHELAGVLVYLLWDQSLTGEPLYNATKRLMEQSAELQWPTLVFPFIRFRVLHPAIPELETIVIRLGNLIAKADGQATTSELVALKNIQNTIFDALQILPKSGEASSQKNPRSAQAKHHQNDERASSDGRASELTNAQVTPPPASLDEIQEELAALVGMTTIKSEVQTFINFLKMQQLRGQADLPITKISLHMVFMGNPGTGKTTVARILGQIYGAMGILAKGHLIETDRSGLVAEFAGQTGPKSNRLIDQALDGVLFIDEAYSLVAETGDDPYGAEAVQALLKRMEDNRDRLVVILAGYPAEVERMLKSNPGLSSRFSRTINFPDFSPGEMAQIFFRMCQKHEYVIEKEAFARLLTGIHWLHLHRDEHFGNGRLVRNLFEGAVRHLANRIVLHPKVDRQLLTQFLPEDICFDGLPDRFLDQVNIDELRFDVVCPKCVNKSKIRARFLGCRVQCGHCRESFMIELAEPSPRNDGPVGDANSSQNDS